VGGSAGEVGGLFPRFDARIGGWAGWLGDGMGGLGRMLTGPIAALARGFDRGWRGFLGLAGAVLVVVMVGRPLPVDR
jgi:hypothetical protein